MGKSVKEGIMPKEFINNRYYGQYAYDHHACPGRDDRDGCPGDSTCVAQQVALDDSAVKVGWSKEAEHVEVAVVHHRDGVTAADEHEAWHSQFDRNGLNRLIRVFRQARDDAYGRDE